MSYSGEKLIREEELGMSMCLTVCMTGIFIRIAREKHTGKTWEVSKCHLCCHSTSLYICNLQKVVIESVIFIANNMAIILLYGRYSMVFAKWID